MKVIELMYVCRKYENKKKSGIPPPNLKRASMSVDSLRLVRLLYRTRICKLLRSPGIGWAGTTTRFLVPINSFKIPAQYSLFREELRLEAEKEQKKKGNKYSHFFYKFFKAVAFFFPSYKKRLFAYW
jgi:hypothetical protein